MPRPDLVLVGITCITLFFASYPAFAGGALTPARKAELIHLLKNDCGSCHGMTLKGGLGPSLLPEALSGKPPEALRSIILDGVPDTPMPPWRGLLTENEVAWLVATIQHGIPHE